MGVVSLKRVRLISPLQCFVFSQDAVSGLFLRQLVNHKMSFSIEANSTC